MGRGVMLPFFKGCSAFFHYSQRAVTGQYVILFLWKLEKAATAAERMAQVKEEKQLILAAMAKYESK